MVHKIYICIFSKTAFTSNWGLMSFQANEFKNEELMSVHIQYNVGFIFFLYQIVGRLIVGFGTSLSAIAECIYIAEIAPPVSL